MLNHVYVKIKSIMKNWEKFCLSLKLCFEDSTIKKMEMPSWGNYWNSYPQIMDDGMNENPQ